MNLSICQLYHHSASAYTQVYAGHIFCCTAYTLISSHTPRYQVFAHWELNVWQCGDHSFHMCRFVLESAARNMKMKTAVVKIFLKLLYWFTYYVLRFIMQICIYRRNRPYISRSGKFSVNIALISQGITTLFTHRFSFKFDFSYASRTCLGWSLGTWNNSNSGVNNCCRKCRQQTC